MTSRPLQPLNSGQLNAKASVATNNYLGTNVAIGSNMKTPIKNASGAVTKPSGENKTTKKKKEKLSALCKTPPSVVRTRNGRGYQRGSFLGEGGFARCFQMKDESGKVYAAKTVAKASIKNEKTKTKLLSEIKIHKSMVHPNVVQFIDCFEDNTNVYILLEICPNQSLMELLKNRKLLTEPEVRLFMVQIIGAVKYLHRRRVIHRDLKLGNIFFDPEMNLKIGDFGLASVMSHSADRRYTICGTPNYIAPEVLGGKNTGHSFEVDIWAIGIMMYALLFGKPPFQARDVQVIYDRVKHNEYSFPENSTVSNEARVLIKDLLAAKACDRPTIDSILEYPWFRSGAFPSKTTVESLTQTPRHLSFITPEESIIYFANWKAKVGMNDSYKNPVQILKTDLESDRPKTLLPNSLSPGNTKSKYTEIDPVSAGVSNNRLNSDLKNAAENNRENEATLSILNEAITRTLSNIRRIQEDVTHIPDEIAYKRPVIVSKWVDYSNKHGFSYQLSTGAIGVLFNNGETIMTFEQNDNAYHFQACDEGWRYNKYSSNDVPSSLKREVEIVDFFKKYMTANLSDISSQGNNQDSKNNQEPVFLRRYTRESHCIMFELSDDSYQFNFKDHHKLILSENGDYVTHISPNKQISSHLLSSLIHADDFKKLADEHFDSKFNFIKYILRKKLTSL